MFPFLGHSSNNLYSSLLTIASLQSRNLQCSVSIPVRYVYNSDLPRASYALQFLLRAFFRRPYFAYFEKVLLLLRAKVGHTVSKCPDILVFNLKNLYSSLLTTPSLLRCNLQCHVSISVRCIIKLLQILHAVKHLVHVSSFRFCVGQIRVL